MIARQPTELEVRVEMAQAALDSWAGRPFSWKTYSNCVKMTAEHLARMGWKPKIAKAGSYKTALGARRALERAGFASLADALDAMGLIRIPPAAAIVGDILELPGEAPFNALTIALGNGRVLGFHEDLDGAGVMQPIEFIAAWRVIPRR